MKISKATLIALTAVSLMSTPVFADMMGGSAATVKCYGANSCKGQSACKTASNSCKGQNTCKGKGFIMTNTPAQCTGMGGSLQETK